MPGPQEKRIRFGVALWISVVVVLYLLFVASVWTVYLHFPLPWQAPNQRLWNSDFARMWYVGRSLLAAWHLTPPPPLLPYGDILAPGMVPDRAWVYPPPTGLIAMPVALLPLSLAFWVWRAGSIILGYWLLRRAGLKRLAVILGLAGPAAVIDLSGGQIGTLTGSLFVAALLFAERSPRGAGVCAGALAIKPQIALMIPFAWARRRFKASYIVAAITVLLVLAATLVLEGKGTWLRYFGVGMPDSLLLSQEPFSEVNATASFTVTYLFRSFGVSPHLASIVQDFVSLLTLLAVWLAWKPDVMLAIPRMAFTVCLSLLATPYGYAYDLVGYAVAMMALVAGLSGWPAFLAALLWLMSGYTIFIFNITGLLLFPFCALSGAVLAWRFRHEPALQ